MPARAHGVGMCGKALVRTAVLAVGLYGVAGPVVALADCFGRNDRLAEAKIDEFRHAQPRDFLANYPSTGTAPTKAMADLTRSVRDLVASSPDTLRFVLGLAPFANEDQQRAIGSGLGQATLICLPVDRAFATQIQSNVLALQKKPVEHRSAAVGKIPYIILAQAFDPAPTSDFKPLIDAFLAVLGDQGGIGSTSGGGGSGGGAGAAAPASLGGSTGANTTNFSPFATTTTVPNTNPFGGSSSSAGFVNGTTTGTTTNSTIATSVSSAGSP